LRHSYYKEKDPRFNDLLLLLPQPPPLPLLAESWFALQTVKAEEIWATGNLLEVGEYT